MDVAAALSQLHTEGVQRLLVEGGGTLNAELLKQGLVDELFVYIAPLIFGGSAAPTFADGPGFNQADANQLKLLQVEMQEHGGILASYAVLHGTACRMLSNTACHRPLSANDNESEEFIL